MKKFCYSLGCLFLTISSLCADITSNLDSYTCLDCSFALAPHQELAEETVLYYEGEHAVKKKNRQDRKGHPHPNRSIREGQSQNWGGYVSATNLKQPAAGSVSNVSGAWVVPQLQPSNEDTYSAIWVGIDGYNSPTVEQIGTEQDWSSGTQVNYAWFEMFPRPSYLIQGFPIDTGDFIQAEVDYQGKNRFKLSLVNHTKNTYTIIPSKYTTSAKAQRKSAEWIAEPPSLNSSILPLANFQSVVFANCKATINNKVGGITGPNRIAMALNMVTRSGIVKVDPSGLSANQESFIVNWLHQ